MWEFLARRILFSIFAIMMLIVAVFVLARVTGSPALLYLPVDATPQVIKTFNRVHGFDQPVAVQFIRYLDGVVHLDFGKSIRRDAPAMDLVLQAFPWTLRLAGVTLVLSMVVALIAGPIAGYRPQGLVDRSIGTLSFVAASSPDFWIAIIFILIFAVQLGWLPTSGTGSIQYWILPISVLMLKITGVTTQVVRGSVVTSLASPYVKAARTKGMPERRVVFIHALRNSLISAVAVAGDQARGLINGAVIVETIFGWPGVGRLMMEAITYRDFAVLQAAVLVTATAIFVLNIVIDILYAVLDPRIRMATT